MCVICFRFDLGHSRARFLPFSTQAEAGFSSHGIAGFSRAHYCISSFCTRAHVDRPKRTPGTQSEWKLVHPPIPITNLSHRRRCCPWEKVKTIGLAHAQETRVHIVCQHNIQPDSHVPSETCSKRRMLLHNATSVVDDDDNDGRLA